MIDKRMVDRLNHGMPQFKDFLLGTWIESVDNAILAIRGVKFYVDAEFGDYANSGLSPSKALPNILAAYAKCVSGRGDGIILLSGGTTTAKTTSYLKKTLTWDKWGITVVGVAAPTRLYGRARIASQEITSTSTTVAEGVGFITRETGSFVTDGWIPGMTGKIADSGSNNNATFTVTAVSDLQLTISESLNVQSKTSTVSCVLTSYIAKLIDVTGSNNAFFNVHSGNYGSSVLSLGGTRVAGNRNYFGNCHMIGAGHATPAADAGAYDLEIDGGQENTFESCVFGTDTIIRAATNGNIRFKNHVWRARFYDCETLSYSDTSTKGAVLFVDANVCDGIQVFSRCRFMNWNENGIGVLAAAFIGTAPTSGAILVDACSEIGFTAWSATGKVYVGNSAYVASGGGGIATPV